MFNPEPRFAMDAQSDVRPYAIDAEAETSYWREHYRTRPYAAGGETFDAFEPAYRYGAESFGEHPGRTFDEAESDLSQKWSELRGSSSLGWDRAKHAVRDAWNRLSDSVERAIPGDSDRDGK